MGNTDKTRINEWLNAVGDANRPDVDSICLTEERTEHILIGDLETGRGGHRHRSGVPNKTTFPPDWSDERIIASIIDVARNPDASPFYQPRYKTWLVEGIRDDVVIQVAIQSDGHIRTGFPPEGKGVHRNDENGVPVRLPWPNPE